MDDSVSPRMDLSKEPLAIESLMFSNTKAEKMDDRKPDVLISLEENPRVLQIKNKVRYAFDDKGKPVSKNKVYQLRDGLFEAIIHRFYTDPTLVGYGEDNRDWGGAFAVYRGLTESLPYHRFFNAPFRSRNRGQCRGLCNDGGRALVELMYCDFIEERG